MSSLIRARDGSAEKPGGKIKWRTKGELLHTSDRGISLSAVEHDDGVWGEKNLFHQETRRGVKATAPSNATFHGKLS
jgi:hypothetical protein